MKPTSTYFATKALDAVDFASTIGYRTAFGAILAALDLGSEYTRLERRDSTGKLTGVINIAPIYEEPLNGDLVALGF